MHLYLDDGTERSFDAAIKGRNDFLNTKTASTKERLKTSVILLHSLTNSRSRIPVENLKIYLYKPHKKQDFVLEITDRNCKVW